MPGKKSIEAFLKRDGTNFNYVNVLDVVATGMYLSDTHCSSFYLVPTDIARDCQCGRYTNFVGCR
jgi:hypothetical protein